MLQSALQFLSSWAAVLVQSAAQATLLFTTLQIFLKNAKINWTCARESERKKTKKRNFRFLVWFFIFHIFPQRQGTDKSNGTTLWSVLLEKKAQTTKGKRNGSLFYHGLLAACADRKIFSYILKWSANYIFVFSQPQGKDREQVELYIDAKLSGWC